MPVFIRNWIWLSVGLWAATPARAQELGGADRPKVVFNEVEHGAYAGADIGVLFLEAPGLGSGLASGSVIEINLGYDITDWLGIGVFGAAIAVSSPSGYGGFGNGTAQGDFTGIMPGGELRLHLPLGKDQNDASRFYVNLDLGGGLMFLQPRSLFPSGSAPGARVDLSLEYFTHLRHFSLGLALQGLAAFPQGTATASGQLIGGALSPFIRFSI